MATYHWIIMLLGSLGIGAASAIYIDTWKGVFIASFIGGIWGIIYSCFISGLF